MKKLSEYKDEAALDLLADILEPAAEIMGDPEMKEAFQNGNRMKMAKAVIKAHKKAVLEILAVMEGVPVEEYHCNVFTLPMRVIEVLNDDALISVFTSQAQEMMQSVSSGSATENTKGEDK